MSVAARSKENIISATTKWTQVADVGFVRLTFVLSAAVAVLLAAIAAVVFLDAGEAFGAFGFSFLTSTDWNPIANNETGSYGILPQIYGTIVSSFLALFFAVPFGFGIAIFLTESWPVVPPVVQTILSFMVELLAAIPSVVYGIWGIFIVIPIMTSVGTWLFENLGWVPIFSQPPTGASMLVAGLVLAIMILPTVAAISREALLSISQDLRMGSMALGATRWETILRVILPTGRSGLIGAVMLGLARAMGETMAVAMVIGNANKVNISILQPASTIPSLLANQFAEASGLQISALMYAAFVLLIITLLTNILAELLIGRH